MKDISSISPGSSILLLDDEPLVRMGIAFLLEELGHNVLQAGTAVQGLEMLESDAEVDLIISDFRMPDMNGLEMIGRAKKMRPAIKALLMTGYAANDERFADTDIPRLAKPFGVEALELALTQI